MDDNKKKGKGFFATLKCKPQTLAEAKQKTKNFFILIGAFTLPFALLCALVHILFGLIVALGSAGIFAFLYYKEDQKNKRNFCSNCGTKINYEEGVAWHVVNYDEKTYSPDGSKGGRQRVKTRIANVEFTCTCLECGESKSFNQKFDVVVWYNDGTVEKNPIETLAQDYFKI